MKQVKVGDIRLQVQDVGSGPAVLLLHGFPDDHEVWRHQVDALVAAGYRVIAPDLRGCGQSDMPPGVADYALAKLVGDVAGLLDALGVERVKLVAHDWGAVIGWAFVMAHPARVERYVALSVGHPLAYASGGPAQKLKGWYVLMFQLRGLAEWLLRSFNWELFGALTSYPAELPHWRAKLQRPGRLTAALNYYRANLSMLWRRAYPPVLVPVVGIHSDGDRFLTRGQMEESVRFCAAGFRFVEVKGAGHWLQLEAPTVVNPLILNALKEEQTA